MEYIHRTQNAVISYVFKKIDSSLDWARQKIEEIHTQTPTSAPAIGTWTVFTGWIDLRDHLITFYGATVKEEKDNALRLIGIDLINLTYSAIAVTEIFFTAIPYCKGLLYPIGALSSLMGLYFEQREVQRSLEFLYHLESPVSSKETLINLAGVYFPNKSDTLALRVQVWCKDKIENELEDALEDPDKAKALLETLRAQGEKTLYIHVFALIGFTFISTGFLALTAGCSSVAMFPMLLVGSGFCLASSTYATISLPCEGWNYDLTYLLPSYIRSCIKSP